MFSAFSFENHFKEIKQMLRKSAQPLQQLHRRLIEKPKNIIIDGYESEEYPILQKANNLELPFGCTHSYQKAKFKNFTLSCTKQADSYCYMDNKNVLKIDYICKKNGEIVIIGKILKNPCNVVLYPCDSRHLGIHVGDEWSEAAIHSINKISTKAMRLPYKNTCYITLFFIQTTSCRQLEIYHIVWWDQFCLAIPHCWINFKEKTFTCPASKSNVTNAVKKKINPGNDWKVYNYYKILGPYDSYDKTRDVEKLCIDISISDDIQLATLKEVRSLPTKRLLTPKTFYGDSDNDTHSNALPRNLKQFNILHQLIRNIKIVLLKLKKKRNSESMPNPEFNIKHNKTLYLSKNKSFSNIPPSLNHHPFSTEIFHENSEDEETEMNSNSLDYNPENFNDKENENFDYDNNHEGINDEGFDSEFDNEKIDNEENEDLNREAEENGLPIIEKMNTEDIHITLHSLYEKMNILHEDFQQFKTEMSINKRKIDEMLIILREKFPNKGNEEIMIDLMPDFPLKSVEEYTG